MVLITQLMCFGDAFVRLVQAEWLDIFVLVWMNNQVFHSHT